MNEPLVSVIVPTFNRKDWLPITLQSLKNQTYQNIEIVVVNDAGENVSSIIEGMNDDRFRYFEHSENKGLAATRNTALRNCKGDYICFLDDDDIYLPLAVEFRMDQIKKLNADIVYTRALQNIYELKGNQYQVVHRQLYWDSPFDRDLILVQNIAPCCCPLFSRKSWEETGYWLDEELTTTEDQDFWTALSRKFDFHELKLVDCECSYRNHKNGQMTGTRNFAENWPRVFKRWRNTAQNLQWVTETQNRVLRNVGIDPGKFGL